MAPSTVLVIDDDPLIVEFLQVALEVAGYTVLAALGSAALQIAQSMHPDVVLLDIAMPGMDGVEMSRRLRADPVTADIPQIVISAQDGLLATSSRMPVDGQLSKPFELRCLYEIVARWAPAP
ncbi:MAG TPA: response regulator [Chloroflexota bacterium]|jgi:CheY-like chemotaxis protein|nr:response regulator [Chloroflexota bacterium]